MSKRVVESTGLALTADSRVDLNTGLITGAKIIGTESKNGRHYPADLLAQRLAIYEGAQVYADHDYSQQKTGRARPMTQWGGVLSDVGARPDGLYGNLQCLKETNAGRVILEAAHRFPTKFGLSPYHLIDTRKEADGTETVTAILEVWSVDAVTRPATTRGLFEEDQSMPDAPPAGAATTMSLDEWLGLGAAIIMGHADYDDNEKLAATKELFKFKAKITGGDEEPADEPPPGDAPAEESHRLPAPSGLRRVVNELANTVRAVSIRQMAGESLPLDAATMASLLALPDEQIPAQLEALRRSRPRRFAAGPPRSQPRRPVGESQNGNQQQRPAAVPRVTAGASREDVKKHYRS